MAKSATTSTSIKDRFRAEVVHWWQANILTWVYALKTLIAVFLALVIALRLDLPQPLIAMVTVFVVMHRQSGAVLAKSLYQIGGTFVGLVATLVFVGAFGQSPELFLTALALWTGICIAGAARHRNFLSYAFLLAGYTVAIVGIPGGQFPESAFLSATTRGAEVVLGVLSAGFVSALVLPQRTGELLRTTVRTRHTNFVRLMAASLRGAAESIQDARTNERLLDEFVGFEFTRGMAVVDDHEIRMRSGRLARLNSEFITAWTRFHTLQRSIDRLRAADVIGPIEALESNLDELATLLSNSGETTLVAADAAQLAEQLDRYKVALRQGICETPRELGGRRGRSMLEFDTTSELLCLFVDAMHEYALTYASLAWPTDARENAFQPYESATNVFAAIVSGVRGPLLIGLLGAFWIATAWPSGSSLVFYAVIVSCLASSSANPTRMAIQMGIGTIIATLIGFVVTFGVYPYIDGFPMLCVALVPPLAFGVWLTSRQKDFGIGMGYCIFFCVLAGPDNVMHYDPESFMGTAFARLLSMVATALAFAIFAPPSSPWLRSRLLNDLRRQVELACQAPLVRISARFESRARDIAYQICAVARPAVVTTSGTIAWLVLVLEVGHAVIDLRSELAALPRDRGHATSMVWRRRVVGVGRTLIALFKSPSRELFDAALMANGKASDSLRRALNRFDLPSEEQRRLHRVICHLHFIRTALQDPKSPLAVFLDSEREDAGRQDRLGGSRAS